MDTKERTGEFGFYMRCPDDEAREFLKEEITSMLNHKVTDVTSDGRGYRTDKEIWFDEKEMAWRARAIVVLTDINSAQIGELVSKEAFKWVQPDAVYSKWIEVPETPVHISPEPPAYKTLVFIPYRKYDAYQRIS